MNVRVFLMFVVFCSCKSQKFSVRNIRPHSTLTANGYLYNIYGQNGVWIFQPSKRKASKNSVSFIVNIARYDLGYAHIENIQGIGNKSLETFYDHRNDKLVKDTIERLYCKVTFFSYKFPERFDSSDYTVFYKNQTINLSSIYFDNFLMDVEPLDSLPRKNYLLKLGSSSQYLKWNKKYNHFLPHTRQK